MRSTLAPGTDNKKDFLCSSEKPKPYQLHAQDLRVLVEHYAQKEKVEIVVNGGYPDKTKKLNYELYQKRYRHQLEKIKLFNDDTEKYGKYAAYFKAHFHFSEVPSSFLRNQFMIT